MTPEQAIGGADVVLGLGCNVPQSPARYTYCTDDIDKALTWVQQHWRVWSVRLCVAVGIDYARKHIDELPAFLHRLDQLDMDARGNQATVTEKAEQHMLNFARSLVRLRSVPWATRTRPERVMPAFIVGGGSSLDLNGHLLGEAKEKGLVLAVNTSCGAVTRHGIEPHATICMESKDNDEVTAGLSRSGGGLHILDAFAGEGNWALPCRDQRMLAHYDASICDHVLRTRGLPLGYQGNCTAAVAALAVHWRCDPIILVGCDAENSERGVYAKGTPFEDLRAEQDGDDLMRYTGQSKRMPLNMIVWAEGNPDKSQPVATNLMLYGFVRWLSRLAKTRRVINASERGVWIDDAEHTPLRQVIDALPTPEQLPQCPPAAQPESQLAQLEVQRLRQACQRVLDAPEHEVTSAFHMCPLLHNWQVVESVRQRYEGKLTPAQKVMRYHEAARTGARQVLEALGC